MISFAIADDVKEIIDFTHLERPFFREILTRSAGQGRRGSLKGKSHSCEESTLMI